MAIFGHGITLGNKVYLYRLLAREVGFGKQTYLPRIQEVLEADGIAPQDMGCETALEVMEQLGEFVRVASFKGGRAYVTLSHVEKWDVELEKLSKSEQKDAGGKGGRPWKRSKGSSTLRPQKPRHRERKKPKATPTPEPKQADKSMEESAVTVEVAVQEGKAAEDAVAEATTKTAPEPETAPADVAATEPKPETERKDEPETTPADAAATEPEPETNGDDKPQAEEPPAQDDNVAGESTGEPLPADDTSRLRLTVTYDPYADMERDLADRGQQGEPEAQPTPEPPEPKEEVRTLPRDLPQSLASEAQCPGAILVELAAIVPLGDDPLTWLDRDWQRARAYGLIAGTRSNVSFPLTLKRLDGTGPATATLRKSRKASSTRLWQISSVEIGEAPEGDLPGIEGTARTSAGPWSALDLCATSDADPLAALAPMDDDARESFRAELAAAAQEGQWCTSASTQEVLTHVALMLAKAQALDELVDEGGLSWFPLALVGKNGNPLQAALAADTKVHVRESASAATTTDVSLIASLLGDTPIAAGQEAIAAIAATSGSDVTPELIEQARRLARTDWRRTLLAWSPETHATYLLLPLAGSTVYLSLTREGAGLALRGCLGREHALACARTCSAS